MSLRAGLLRLLVVLLVLLCPESNSRKDDDQAETEKAKAKTDLEEQPVQPVNSKQLMSLEWCSFDTLTHLRWRCRRTACGGTREPPTAFLVQQSRVNMERTCCHTCAVFSESYLRYPSRSFLNGPYLAQFAHFSAVFFAVFSVLTDARKRHQKTGARFRNGPKRPKEWAYLNPRT